MLDNDLTTGPETKALVISIDVLDNIHHQMPSEYVINGKTFEQRCVISTHNVNAGGEWKGEVCTRHGLHFNSFWYQHRRSKFPIESYLPEFLDIAKDDIYAYVLCEPTNIESF